VTARDDAAHNFTAVRRGRPWTYQVTDKPRFVVGGALGSWWDVRVGTVVQVRWHRAGSQPWPTLSALGRDGIEGGSMFAFGTKRTSQPCRGMTAFGGKADVGQTRLNVHL